VANKSWHSTFGIQPKKKMVLKFNAILWNFIQNNSYPDEVGQTI
jgi:hypothetical protein